MTSTGESAPGSESWRGPADPAVTFGFAALLVVHAAIHVARFLKAFRLVELHRLTHVISRGAGLLSLLAAIGFAIAAVLLVDGTGRWRLVAVGAVLVSQMVILIDFRDAGFGTLGNVLVVLAVVFR